MMMWEEGRPVASGTMNIFKVILASTSDEFSWHRKQPNKQKHSNYSSTSNQACCMWSVLGYDKYKKQLNKL